MMRTTISIDDDVLAAARSLARQRQQSLGVVVSELIRRGLQPRPGTVRKQAFPVFAVPANARPVTLETVRSAEEEPG